MKYCMKSDGERDHKESTVDRAAFSLRLNAHRDKKFNTYHVEFLKEFVRICLLATQN